MSRVVNRSESVVEVYGTDTTTSQKVRWLLLPGMESVPTFECEEVRATDDQDAEIFSSQEWWKVLRPQAFIYTFDSGFFTDSLSLHCFPYDPATPPFHRGYELAGANSVRDALLLTDPQQTATAAWDKTKEGELAKVPEADFGFGRQVRTRIQNDIYISERLKPVPSSKLEPADLTKLPSKQDLWKKLVELTWNPASVQGTNGERLHIELDWVETACHYELNIIKTPSEGVTGFFTGRTTYDRWPIDLDDAATVPEKFPVCAHEFGHMLGLNDGYIQAFELPFLEDNAQLRADLLASGENIVKPAWTVWVQPLFYFWLGKPRATERLSGSKCSIPGDIMDDQFGRDKQPRQVIDTELVDAIVERRRQALCYAKRQFHVDEKQVEKRWIQ